MKALRVTKKVIEVKFEGVWADLEPKEQIPETIADKISETTFGFHVTERTTRKV